MGGGLFFNLTSTSTLNYFYKNNFSKKKILILIDCEGGEYPILKKGNLFINSKKKPIWIIEITKKNWIDGNDNPNFLSTFEILLKNNYYAYCIEHHFYIKSFNREVIVDLPGANYIFYNKKKNINSIF
jgi:hypothetical protein